MFNYGVAARLRNFRGLGALDLLMNKSNYTVGEAPFFTVTGGTPEMPVLWSSTKNGLPTGEANTDYGHKTDAVGVWSGAGGNWTNENVGQWTKSVKIGSEVDTAAFQVLPAGVQSTGGGNVYIPPSQQQRNQPGFFDEEMNLFGYDLPKWLVYGAGAGLLYWTFFKKK